MENERKESKTKPVAVSLTPATEAAGKLMASRRFSHLLTGNFSAYIRDLIERDVFEEIRRDPALRAKIAPGSTNAIAAFVATLSQSAPDAHAEVSDAFRQAKRQREPFEKAAEVSPTSEHVDPLSVPKRQRKQSSPPGSKNRTREKKKGLT